MIIYPKCKVNVGLRILRKREDRFHDLESLFLDSSSPSDILEIVESSKLSIKLYGAELDCAPEDNICIKAYNLIKQNYNIPPVEIHLMKRIPSGAGLGGGSSNGSCTLIVLDKLFGLNLSEERLATLSASLGSDCPYFIYAHSQTDNRFNPVLVTGRGDRLRRLSIPALDDIRVEIHTPDIFVSTAEAYMGVTPQIPPIPIEQILEMPIESWRDHLKNDFESHIFRKYPILGDIKRDLYARGALYASMSGSGSSLFGLFRV